MAGDADSVSLEPVPEGLEVCWIVGNTGLGTVVSTGEGSRITRFIVRATGLEQHNRGVLAMEVAPRVAPVLLLVRDAAASDPELARLQAEMDAARLTRMTHNARTLLKGGHLRRGITLDEAADVLWTYSSPELYDMLVIRRGWAVERYGRFIADAMIAALLPG